MSTFHVISLTEHKPYILYSIKCRNFPTSLYPLCSLSYTSRGGHETADVRSSLGMSQQGSFVGVLRAVYDYEAASEQELSISEGDILYLLERADDGWWTVKKRVPLQADKEPTGIVPHNYVEPAPSLGNAHSLYSYEQQSPEEVSFSEGTVFNVYADDGDWILVGSDDKYGFVPANYIDRSSQAPPAAPAPPAPVPAPAPPLQTPAVAHATRQPHEELPPEPSAGEAMEDNEGPPLPSRPGRGNSIARTSTISQDSPREPPGPPQLKPDEFQSWAVAEIDGRKRTKSTFAASATSVMLSRSHGDQEQWDVEDVISYSGEKRHVFVELRNPRLSLDLKVSSQDVCDQIVTALGQVVGASRGGGGLDEVLAASQTTGNKVGTIQLDFKAVNGREVSVKEGEPVFVLNMNDKEWWLIRTTSGREGLVPRKFIEIEGEKFGHGPKGLFKAHKDREGRKTREKERQKERHNRQATTKGGRHESRHERSQSRLSSHRHNSLPSSSKMRTWVDRSGTFRVEAALLGVSDGKVHLHKVNGVKIAVPASKLSVSDVEYVESVTGTFLSSNKPLIDGAGSSPTKPNRSHSNAEGFDWFQFFLECGVEVNNCQRYATNFTRDKMDDSILPEINASNLRTLGLKEGDILRVTKKLNEKFGRSQDVGVLNDPTASIVAPSSSASDVPPAIQAESKGPAAPALVPNAPPQPQSGPLATTPVQSQPTGALADLLGVSQPLQPQKTAEAQLSEQQRQQQQQILKQQSDLQHEQINLLKQQQESLREQQQELVRMRTGIQQSRQQRTMATGTPTGLTTALGPFATGVAALPTGNTNGPTPVMSSFAPNASGVLAAPQPPQPRVPQGSNDPFKQLFNQATGPKPAAPATSFSSSNLQQQPTGPFAQIPSVNPAPTGYPGGSQSGYTGFQPQSTGGNLPQMSPFQTGPFASQVTGPTPVGLGAQTTGPFSQYGQSQFQPQKQPTGSIAPTFQTSTTFQQQTTGPFQQQPTGPFQQQPTGPFQQQPTGPFQQQPTGPFQQQPTGPFQQQPTGPFQQQPTGPFQQQPTGPFQQQPTGPFQQQPTGPFQQQPTGPFQQQPTGPFQQQPNGMFQQPTRSFQQQTATFQQHTAGPFQQQSTSIQQQPTGPFQQQPTPFQQQPTYLQQQSTGPFLQQPPSFQQQQQQPATGLFQQQPTSFQQQPTTGLFQQQPTGPFGAAPGFPSSSFPTGTTTNTPVTFNQSVTQPLQSQATGFGFGNQQQSQVQQRANFSAATVNNPFGL